ncbi:MAG: hypothetical protein WCW02_01790 [Candidatus Buchananbacteria bacterium]
MGCSKNRTKNLQFKKVKLRYRVEYDLNPNCFVECSAYSEAQACGYVSSHKRELCKNWGINLSFINSSTLKAFVLGRAYQKVIVVAEQLEFNFLR